MEQYPGLVATEHSSSYDSSNVLNTVADISEAGTRYVKVKDDLIASLVGDRLHVTEKELSNYYYAQHRVPSLVFGAGFENLGIGRVGINPLSTTPDSLEDTLNSLHLRGSLDYYVWNIIRPQLHVGQMKLLFMLGRCGVRGTVFYHGYSPGNNIALYASQHDLRISGFDIRPSLGLDAVIPIDNPTFRMSKMDFRDIESRQFYFPTCRKLEALEIDYEGSFSLSSPELASAIKQRVGDAKVVDFTVGCGSLIQWFDGAIGYELNPARCRMAQRNLRLVDANCTIVNDSALTHVVSGDEVVLFDPPFGGSSVFKKQFYSLDFGGKNVIKVILDVVHTGAILFLKMPSGYLDDADGCEIIYRGVKVDVYRIMSDFRLMPQRAIGPLWYISDVRNPDFTLDYVKYITLDEVRQKRWRKYVNARVSLLKRRHIEERPLLTPIEGYRFLDFLGPVTDGAFGEEFRELITQPAARCNPYWHNVFDFEADKHPNTRVERALLETTHRWIPVGSTVSMCAARLPGYLPFGNLEFNHQLIAYSGWIRAGWSFLEFGRPTTRYSGRRLETYVQISSHFERARMYANRRLIVTTGLNQYIVSGTQPIDPTDVSVEFGEARYVKLSSSQFRLRFSPLDGVDYLLRLRQATIMAYTGLKAKGRSATFVTQRLRNIFPSIKMDNRVWLSGHMFNMLIGHHIGFCDAYVWFASVVANVLGSTYVGGSLLEYSHGRWHTAIDYLVAVAAFLNLWRVLRMRIDWRLIHRMVRTLFRLSRTVDAFALQRR